MDEQNQRQSYRTTIEVAEAPHHAFECILDVSKWFELAPAGARTVLHFTHEGLFPDKECYSRCARGWSTVIGQYLFRFITEGVPHFS